MEEKKVREHATKKKSAARKRRELNRRRRRKALLMRFGTIGGLLLILIAATWLILSKLEEAREKKEAERAYQEQLIREEEQRNQRKKELIAQAERIAQTYDFDGAINLLKSIKDYEKDGTLIAKVANLQAQRSTMVAVPMTEVTHVFLHSLIVDTERAFEGGGREATNYKQWFTTVTEFENIIQQMYENDYVLVSVYDLVKQSIDENGEVKFSANTIYLPSGKKPYVMSIDDMNYYHSYEGRGFASKLVLDANGDVTCEYVQADGTVVTGDYDCVPILDKFIEEHPDASYKGAKATIGLTGYNGILGYRTDVAYSTRKNLDADQREWLSAQTDFNWEKECADAKIVAARLKETGWTFASNTWGQIAVGHVSLERLKEDTEKWISFVEPLIGETDIIAFSRGQDIGNWRYYSDTNEKYSYLKSQGFHFFLNVDPAVSFYQLQEECVRQGRRSLDGYRLWNDVHGTKNWTSDLFDAAKVLDSKRTDMPGL